MKFKKLENFVTLSINKGNDFKYTLMTKRSLKYMHIL